MNKKIIITDEEKEQIISEYNNKNINVDDILLRHHISSGTLSLRLRERGVPFRREGMCKPRSRTKKACSWCKQTVSLPGAKYCPFCGRNIQTEGEIITDKLTGLFQYGTHLPLSTREHYREVLNKAIDYIKENDK